MSINMQRLAVTIGCLFLLCLSAGCPKDPLSGSVAAGAKVNTRPTAQHQTITVEEGVPYDVTLTATDVDGDPLTFVIVEDPVHGFLEGEAPEVTYTSDIGYTGWDNFTFQAFDGLEWSNIATVFVNVVPFINHEPVADAGEDLNVETGALVVLDGSNSFDPDGDVITFDWRFVSVPATSVLTDDDIANWDAPDASFTPDVDGVYVLDLVVSDDSLDSVPDEVEITASTPNVPPNADAGEDQTAMLGDEVSLDGTASLDPDEGPDALSFEWYFFSLPAESLLTDADISDSEFPNAWFTPDVEGVYVLELSVYDGADADTAQTTVTIMLPNVPPNADAGEDQTQALANGVTLDGSGSTDPDGGPQSLSFSWHFVSVPTASGLTDAHIVDAETSQASFSPDVPGSYLLQLSVSDGADQDVDNVLCVVYDPDGAFVTGGGWIQSPAGAYSEKPNHQGKGQFVFRGKYTSSDEVPNGTFRFMLQKSGLTFRATSFDYLVADGSTAELAGAGTIAGLGLCTFLVVVEDGEPDQFHLCIWRAESPKEGQLIYDNGVTAEGTVPQAGTIVIHDN